MIPGVVLTLRSNSLSFRSFAGIFRCATLIPGEFGPRLGPPGPLELYKIGFFLSRQFAEDEETVFSSCSTWWLKKAAPKARDIAVLLALALEAYCFIVNKHSIEYKCYFLPFCLPSVLVLKEGLGKETEG